MKRQRAVSGSSTSMIRIALALMSVLMPTGVRAQATTELVSTISAGGANGNNYASYAGAPSANGRFVAFESALTEDGQSGLTQIYLYDRQAHTTEIVSVSSFGMQANARSAWPAMSADGRYVTFQSRANNLVPGDTNDLLDIFVRDRQLRTTERISVSSTGVQGNKHAYGGAISADGRYVLFSTESDNMVSGDTNGTSDVFLRDRQTNTTTRISVNPNGVQGNGYSYSGLISADGQIIAFTSNADNLVPGDTNGATDVFVYTRVSHKIERVSMHSTGAEGNNWSAAGSLSADGRFVAFVSAANNLVTGDTNGQNDVFVHDRLTHQTERVSINSQGEEANNFSNLQTSYSLSADGRYVVFDSPATNLASNLTLAFGRIYVHDRFRHTTQLVSVSSTGEPANSTCGYGALSADGQYAMFMSSPNVSNLAPTRSATQIYARGPLRSGVTVSGSLALESIVPTATPQNLEMIFRPANNSGNLSHSITVKPDGQFSIGDIPRQSYTLHIKGDKYLAKNVTIDASNGNVTNVSAILLAGDATDDNSVDVLDLDALIQAFDSATGDSNWNNGRADFNCDGSVDILDLDLLIRNFDAAGDP